MPTPNLGLPTLAQGQAQKEIAYNDALLRLDALVQTSVKSRALATPPGSPANGDRWDRAIRRNRRLGGPDRQDRLSRN